MGGIPGIGNGTGKVGIIGGRNGSGPEVDGMAGRIIGPATVVIIETGAVATAATVVAEFPPPPGCCTGAGRRAVVINA